MVRTIFITAGFFIVVMLALLVAMKNDFLRGTGPWSVEVAGTRVAVPQKDPNLRHLEGDRWEYTDEKGVIQSATVMFTVYQVSLFFSIYVFFQVWNQINARSLAPDMSGFQRIFENPTFLMIAGIVAAGQIVIVTFGGTVFKVEPLSVWDWLGVIAFTSTVLVFAEVSRRLRMHGGPS